MEKAKITVDIVSDVVCPWCFIGKRRLERAMLQLAETYTFEVFWHPFQLNATIPAEGIDWESYMTQKFGSAAQMQQTFDQVTQIGKAEGINFDFVNTKKAINTFHLHRLLRFALEKGRQNQLAEVFFKANFEQNLDLLDNNVLISLLEQVGYTTEEAKEAVLGEHFREETIAVLKHLATQGISGVPLFIINNQYAVSGAQSVESFVNVFTKAKQETTDTTGACDVAEGDC